MQTSQDAVAYSRDPVAADAEGLSSPASQLKMIQERYERLKVPQNASVGRYHRRTVPMLAPSTHLGIIRDAYMD